MAARQGSACALLAFHSSAALACALFTPCESPPEYLCAPVLGSPIPRFLGGALLGNRWPNQNAAA